MIKQLIIIIKLLIGPIVLLGGGNLSF